MLAGGQLKPTALAIDDGYVYWATYDGKLSRIAKRGSGRSTIASIRGTIGGVAIDEQFAYLTSFEDGSLWRVPKAGGRISPVWSCPPGFTCHSTTVVSHGETLYWSLSMLSADAEGTQAVWGMQKRTNTASRVVDGESPFSFAVGRYALYFAPHFAPCVGIIPLAPLGRWSGCIVEANEPTNPWGRSGHVQTVAIDSESLYWNLDEGLHHAPSWAALSRLLPLSTGLSRTGPLAKRTLCARDRASSPA